MAPHSDKLSGLTLPFRRTSLASAAPPLILLSDPERLPDPSPHFARLPAGALVVLRDHEGRLSRRELSRLCAAAHRHRLSLGISGSQRVPYAEAVHLAEWQVRKLANTGGRLADASGRFVSAAAHSEAAIRQAARIGAHAVLISSVFATRSHPGAACLGPLKAAHLAAIARRQGLLPYALGGIERPDQARRLVAASFCGVAGISFVLSPSGKASQ